MDAVERRRILRSPLTVPRGRPFSMMQNAAMLEIARDRDMPRAEIATLLLLASVADDDGIAVGTVEQMAERIGYAVPVVATALHGLMDRGYLVKLKRSVYRVPARVCTPKAQWARATA